MDLLKLFFHWTDTCKTKLSKHHNSLKTVKWKNPRPPPHLPYSPTPLEHAANIITHGVLIVPSYFLSMSLIDSAANKAEFWAALVYGLVLTGLFTVSTVFHAVAAFSSNSLWRDLFHRADRAMIYLFIAGSYTPWLHLREINGPAAELRWVVWVLATLGILYEQLFHEKYKALETVFYVVVALLPSLAVLEMEKVEGLYELQAGGVAYMTGVIFFKCDGVIPLAHAIWHVHVVVGAMIHYYAVDTHLIGINAE